MVHREEKDQMKDEKHYSLHVDGPLFRAQRELLLRIADHAKREQPYEPASGDERLLEGLLNLTESLADQAHDRHGIDCLLDNDKGDAHANDRL